MNNSDKLLYNLAINLSSRENVLELNEQLLEKIIFLFTNKLENDHNIFTSKSLTIFVDSSSPEYDEISKMRDILYKIGELGHFEKKYNIFFEFKENNYREDYGDSRYLGVLITWKYKKYLRRNKLKNMGFVKHLVKGKWYIFQLY